VGAAPVDHDLASWSRAFGAWGQDDSNGNAGTTDRNLGGFVTAVDGGLGSGWHGGLAMGYLNTSLSAGGDLHSAADVNEYILGAYVGGGIGEFALRSGGTWTWRSGAGLGQKSTTGVSGIYRSNRL
jgi:outer membrane autotransporter protein